MRGRTDRVGGEFDAGDLGEVRSEGEREKAGATIDVYEVGWRRRQGARRIRERGSRREDGVVNESPKRFRTVTL